jgi:hypothetical protein
MRKLFLAALVVGLCTRAIMAQETAKAGIYGGLQNLRFDAHETIRQNAKQEPAKVAIYGDLSNLNLAAPETSNQDVDSLPQAPKATFFSAVSHEIGQQYAISPPLNSRSPTGSAGSQAKCPPTCPSIEYNRVEIYGGYSLLSYDLRVFGLFNRTPATVIGRTNIFDSDRQVRFHLNGGDVSVTVNFTRYVGAQFDFSAHSRDVRDLNTAFVVLNTPTFGNLFVIANIPRPEFNVRNFFGGVQFKDNRKEGPRTRPFGHILLGASRERLRIRNVNLFTDLDHDGDIESFTVNFVNRNDNRFRRTSFALALGGGFDIRITDRFSIRPIKIDYLPVFARPPVLVFTPPTVLPTVPIIIPPGANFTLSFVDVNRNRKTRNNIRIGAGVVFHF